MGLILFGSEFGANLGHIYPMLRLADQLHVQGHEIVFAARNLVHTKKALKGTSYKLVQAPFWNNPVSEKVKRLATPSYADVMARQGFGFKDIFSAYLTAWCDLVDFIRPDVIIADHSPTLSMSARGRYPFINIGNGFTLPPSHLSEFPSVLAKGKPIISQASLLSSLNISLAEKGLKTLNALPEIFDTEGQFVCTVPQLDPYFGYRENTQIGPLEESLKPAEIPQTPHVFLYMAFEAGKDNFILHSLKRLGVKATVYLRETSPKIRSAFQDNSITMLDKPADLATVLPACSLVIHSGGGGLSTSSLMTGRPQITFPSHSETALNSYLLSRQGVAVAVKQSIGAAKFTQLLEKVLANKTAQHNAVKIAEKLATENWGNGLNIIVRKVGQFV